MSILTTLAFTLAWLATTAVAYSAGEAYEADLIKRVAAVFGPDAGYTPGGGPVTPVKCGTPLAYEIRMQWPNLTEAARQRLGELVQLNQRPVLQGEEIFDHDTPAGSFRIHYTRVGPDSVDMSFGVGAGNVPAYVLRCAAFIDTTVDTLITGLGYRFPISDSLGNSNEDPRLDIYFKRLGPMFYGLSIPDVIVSSPVNGIPVSTSWIELNSDFSSVPGYARRPFDAMAVTVAHEFHHTVQWSYDAFEAEVRNVDGVPTAFPWFFELTSTYVEDVVFDRVNDYYLLLPFFFDYPWLSLRTFGARGAENLHPYGSVVWADYLAQKYGDRVMVDIWKECGKTSGFNTFDAFETVLEQHGSSFVADWAEFLVWNYFTGDRAADWSYAEGADFDSAGSFGGMIPDSLVAVYDTYPVSDSARPLSPPHRPDELAGAYMLFVPGISETTSDLNLLLSPDNFNEWLVVTAGIRGAARPEVRYTQNVFDPVTVPDWIRFDKVLVIVSPFKSNPKQEKLDKGLEFSFAVRDSFATRVVASAISKVFSNPLEVFGNSGAGENPFQVNIALAEPVDVSMYIYTPAGGLVRGGASDGMYQAASASLREAKMRWDGTNRSNRSVASGVYLAVVRIGDKSEILKVAVKNR